MNPDDVKTVGVLGCGIMGSGIVEVLAKAGSDVIYLERDDARVERGQGAIEKSLQKAVTKGKLDESARDELRGRFKGTTNLDDLAGVDLVIEAVTEDLPTKVDLFSRLDELTKPEVILASNTSSLPLVQMATATKRPDKVIGMHFFNPPPVMKLLELVKALTTSDETVEFAKGFGEKLGKTTVLAKDRAGFIVNLLLTSYLNAAVKMYEEGFASKEDIDTAIKLGLGHPMGPLELLDLIGIDTMLSVGEVLYDEFKSQEFAPPPLARRMVQAGYLGRKTGKGFYDYGQ
ncbi:MAG: 3-hydroxybutyryl-CoA dehydrogenase [Actinomycetota bacterium]